MPEISSPAARRPRAARKPSARLRWRLLRQLERRLEGPMVILGFIWLVLLIVDLLHGLDPLLAGLGTIIWIVFIADFLLRCFLAPSKLRYLEHNWLTLISLAVPALRVFRVLSVLRFARLGRGARLVRVVSSLNRGMLALGKTMRRRGVGYVVALTAIVVLAGAAGMYALEPHASGTAGFSGYGDALWWTAMIMTTLGSAYWPQTAEGRVLGLLISVYAIGVFGYLTATLASFFVDRDAASPQADVASAEDVRAVRRELAALRHELRHAGLTSPASERPPGPAPG